MALLVTGATGFLGSRLAHRLHARGDGVRVLARKTSSLRRLEGVPVDVAIGDVTDRASIERAMDGIETVFHCAAVYEIGASDPAQMEQVNVEGTRNVLEVAHAYGARVVHVSSTAALGPTGEYPADESNWSSEAPRSVYEATKRRAHELARAMIDRGAKIRIAAPVTIYGPDDPSLIGMTHRYFVKGLVPVGARAHLAISFVHVDDCADGVARIAERGRDGELYVLSADVVTFKEWLTALARASGRAAPRVWLPDWLLDAARPGATLLAPLAGFSRALVREGYAMSSDVHWAYSGDKARRELGWSPRPLVDGLREVASFYQRQKGLR
jgi:nucleoside-diphosphate-sugar epimerase